MTRPLDGLRVVDLTSVVAGPTVTRILADCGATVVKVESHARPDGLRSMTPYQGGEPGLNRSGYFAMYNAGKLSLTLNLRKPLGREFFRRYLAPWADVVLEAFAPGVAEQWGLAYEDLRRLKPDIILLRSCLMGHTGPDRDLKGTGQVTAALSGWYELTGWPDRPPVGPYSAYSDFVSWNFALAAILAALDHRRRTGKGQYIDQSLLESTVQFAAPAVLEYTANGREPTRMGNRDPLAAPHGAFRCVGEDRWCVIAVTSQEEWLAFCRAMGAPEWTRDGRFATLEARKRHEDELNALVETWTARLTAEEVMDVLQSAGVPAGVVQDARDLLDRDPQIRHRQGFVGLHHAEMGAHQVLTTSFRLSETPAVPASAAPLLGQHTEYVCKALLGMTDDELADWIAQQVLE